LSRAPGRSRSPRCPTPRLPNALPEPWIEQVELEIGGEVPATFSEPPLERDELDGRTERTIEEVKRTCFPFFGLRP
jgi:hypothetical protein